MINTMHYNFNNIIIMCTEQNKNVIFLQIIKIWDNGTNFQKRDNKNPIGCLLGQWDTRLKYGTILYNTRPYYRLSTQNLLPLIIHTYYRLLTGLYFKCMENCSIVECLIKY